MHTFYLFLCIFFVYLLVSACRQKMEIANSQLSLRPKNCKQRQQFTSASIQPNWHRPASSGPYLGNLPMGGGVPPSGTFNSTAYFNLHALGAAASPLDRTQGGVSSTTSNYLFHYDLRPINAAVFESNNPHFRSIKELSALESAVMARDASTSITSNNIKGCCLLLDCLLDNEQRTTLYLYTYDE